MREIMFLAALTIAAVAVAAACGGGDDEAGPAPAPTLNPADFSTTIDNPLFPLSPGSVRVFEGEEVEDGETVRVRIEHKILDETVVIGGVEALVLEDREYQNGELVEVALDYFAQHRDGSVWYLGEHVDDYENGEVTGHSGQWLSGEGDNRAGIIMPADPVVGQQYNQENAPGVAEDQGKVIAVDQEVTVPAGTFTGCLKTEDSSPLDDVTEFKYYCPDVGLVREEPPEGGVDLISYQ
jgi:hypothetical protein